MAFTSWALIKQDLKDAIADGDIERFFKTHIENHRNMESKFDSMGMMKFYDWVCLKADEEACPDIDEGGLAFSVLGGDG